MACFHGVPMTGSCETTCISLFQVVVQWNFNPVLGACDDQVHACTLLCAVEKNGVHTIIEAKIKRVS